MEQRASGQIEHRAVRIRPVRVSASRATALAAITDAGS